ncbi:MAG: mycoredoxin [Anaerolineales bacterium]|jgi:glutaredoxin-like protein
MSDTTIIVYGTTWCGDCRRARRFLQNHQIDYEWININQDREAEAYVREVNHGNRSVPTILFPDGSILVEPSNLQLAKKLDIEYSW